MKTIYSLKACSIFFAAAWFAGLGLGSPAFADAYIVDLNSKKVIDLGSDVGAYAINDAGQVAGQKSGHAFITGPNGVGMTDLGTLGGAQSSAAGINAAGQVVGWSDTSSGARHAFITDPGGGSMRDLGFPKDILTGFGGNPTLTTHKSSAAGINNAGQVVGWFDGTVGPYDYPYFMHAFITAPNGADIRDFGKDIGGYTRASGINAGGQVAGDVNTDPFSRVFITGQNGIGVSEIDSLGQFHFDSASGINDTGQVIGTSRIFTMTGEPYHAFVTGPNGVGTRDLGALGGDGILSYAYGINDAGQVVGSSEIAPGAYAPLHAFVANPGSAGMVDLNSLVPPPAGVTFTGASAINNVGQVVASGVTAVVPEPESYALMLSGLILIGFVAWSKRLMT